MDAKDLRTESAVSSRNNDGTKYSQGGASLQAHTSKQYQDISSNSLGKVDVPPAPAPATSRPCAVIGPDRVVPPPVATDTYLKKTSLDSWVNTDNSYRRPPDYPLKLTDYQHPSRNISPRQTFQENMQRIMVPPSYNTAKLKEDHNFPVDANVSPLRNNKLNVPAEAKYCEVPYTVNPMTNEQKNVRSADISVSNVNPVLTRSGHGWPPGASNIRPAKPYGAHPEVYQYPDYPSCAGPRPMLMTRPHRTVHEEPGPVYSDPYYHDRFKPYPSVKERYPQTRYDYINYSNPFHPPPPPFPTHTYDPQKPIPPNIYQGYSQVPLKYLDPRMAEHVMNSYQRPSNQQGNFNNVQFHNQVIQSTYGAVPGNGLPNKFYSYPQEGPVKPIASNKIPYDTNNKMYVEYENARAKNYPMSDSFYVNEMARHPMKGPVLSPSYASINMHPLPPHPYYRKENPNPLMKNYEYSPHFRNVDQSINMSRLPTQYSLNSFAISPSDSSTSNDTTQTHGTSQDDCGYASQSSTASIRSMESGVHRIPNDPYRRYDYRYGPIVRASRLPRPEPNPTGNDGSKDKKTIDVRQFLQMWNEGEDEGGDNINKATAKAIFNNASDMAKQHEANNHEQLYVLGLVNVPSEELGKYEHIQKVSKLPENIKGYNSIELLNQFEEVIESSNLNNYNMKPPTRDFHVSLKSSISMQGLGIPPRPISPLDVEAKISQSVIHKEVGCNFEIRPCSPKMLNVEVAAPIHTVLDERVIEKVTNPLNIHSPILHHSEDNIDNMTNVIKRQDRRIILNDNTKVNSCKMINPQFSGNSHDDHVKGNYTMQDLESNAGICLASLPRLDNDCELNFPEVNQQFINANKVESVITQTPKDLPALDIDQCDSVTKDQDGQESENCQFSPRIDLGKELPKLSKYRKHKRQLPNINDNNSVFNHHVMRTDSVIIKNPDNIKSQEDSAKNKSPLNNFTNCVPHSPINLTVNTDARLNDDGIVADDTVRVTDKPNEFAIDFSLNSTELHGYKSKSDATKNNSNEDMTLNDYSFISTEKHVDEKERMGSILAQTDEDNCGSVESCKDNLNDFEIPVIPKVNDLENSPSKICEKNCDTGKSCEGYLNTSFVPDDLKIGSTGDESVINLNSDTVSVNKKVESPNIIYNASENEPMTMLLRETASNSVKCVSKNFNSENVKETTLNNQGDNAYCSSKENFKSPNEDKPFDYDCSIIPKTDPTIDNPIIIHPHKREPFDEDSLLQEVSNNTMSPVRQSHNDMTKMSSTYSVTDHFSLDKGLDQGDRNNSDRKESNSANTHDFYDDMDVEHKMETLFSEKTEQVNEIGCPQELVFMEELEPKCDSDVLKRKLSDIYSNESHNLHCDKLPESKELKYVSEKPLILRETKRYVSKELFCPWIQKLILNDEGLCHQASNLNNELNFKPKMYCTFSAVNNFLSTSAESETKPLTGKVIEYNISECLEKQSTNIVLTSSSDESSEDDTDDTCSETSNELEADHCADETSGKNCEFTHPRTISETINAPTLDKVEIDHTVHELQPKVALRSEPIPIREANNTSNETTLNGASEVTHQQEKINSYIDDTISDVESLEKNLPKTKPSIFDEPQTSSYEMQTSCDELETSSDELQTSSDELETNLSDVKSVVLPGNMSPKIKPIITNEPQTSSDEKQTSSDKLQTSSDELQTSSDELETNLNEVKSVVLPGNMSPKIKPSITYVPQTSSDEIQTSSDKLQTSSDELQTSSDELETNLNEVKSVVLPGNMSPNIKPSITNEPQTSSDEIQTSSDKLQRSSDELVTNSVEPETKSGELETNTVDETVFELISKNVYHLSVDGSICKPVFCNLKSVLRDKTTADDIICKPNTDSTTTEICVDETKIINFDDTVINETNKEIVKPPSLADDIEGTQTAETSQLEIKYNQENTLDEHICENKLMKLEMNAEAIESNNDSGNNTDSSIIEGNMTQYNPVSGSVLEKIVYPDIDHLFSPRENINSSVFSEAEVSLSHIKIAAENINDKQYHTNINNMNYKALSKQHSDLDLVMHKKSSANAEEKFKSLDDIPEDEKVCNTVNEEKTKNLNEDESICEELMHDATIETSLTSVKEFNLKDGQNVTLNTKLNDLNVGNTLKNYNILKNKYSTRKRILKRSYSESALDEYSLSMRENSKLDVSETNFLFMPNKRKKIINTENYTEHLTSENYCNIIHNNRRNSISAICDQNISFCILIDDNCIITEDGEESEKICFTEIPEECLPCAQNSVTDDNCDITEKISELISVQETVTSENSNTFISDYVEDKTLDVSWVEDVACVETVVSDDIAEDVVISASASPRGNDSCDYDSNNDESGIFSFNEHTDKLKYIYGDKMCSDDAQLVETLYRTPQMDVNKTLVHKESQISEDGHRYYDEDSLERVLSESNNCEIKSYETNSIVEFTSSLCPSGFVASDKTPDDKENIDLDNFDDNSLPFGIKNIHCNMESEKPEEKIEYSQMIDKKTQDDTVHSCESSIDNVFSYNQPEDIPKFVISSSSEVSSTTSEDRNSNLNLKITKFRETSTSQVNDFNSGGSISCKYTEKEDCLYSNSKLPSRPLITKAAQKYIPPLKDTIRDLKVKLPLPQNSLQKLKQLKISKEEPKPNINVNKHNITKVLRTEIPKKPKPKFEDVLKSIDEIQFKKHKEKSKKPKKIIPKVVIKKSENGSHYASTSNKDKFNPDLTGRKWQPWVFLEKNNFIDKMALKRKTKAIYSHRKNTYVLGEKFQKYKSESSTKFVISQPNLNESSPGHLKYTIRLKHSY